MRSALSILAWCSTLSLLTLPSGTTRAADRDALATFLAANGASANLLAGNGGLAVAVDNGRVTLAGVGQPPAALRGFFGQLGAAAAKAGYRHVKVEIVPDRLVAGAVGIKIRHQGLQKSLQVPHTGAAYFSPDAVRLDRAAGPMRLGGGDLRGLGAALQDAPTVVFFRHEDRMRRAADRANAARQQPRAGGPDDRFPGGGQIALPGARAVSFFTPEQRAALQRFAAAQKANPSPKMRPGPLPQLRRNARRLAAGLPGARPAARVLRWMRGR